MPAPEIIRQLVERFELHRDAYRAGKYNETQLRREFLDPFFEALGWDVLNKQGYAERYKDVIHEDSLEVEGASKAPDYAFRIGGTRKFFVEAKKPSVNIEMNPEPAFQLRRYVWSAKLPLGILSDFEELAVYECRSKPDKTDKVSHGRVKLLHYTDYLAKWDEIASIFSREAVLKGSFDQFAEHVKGKKGTAEVDDIFLEEIERWRDLLARNIALRNSAEVIRNERDLNYAVQMTIDRIIFLRICEDRGIERDNQLKDVAAGTQVYAGLCQLFKQADARYNSGLFHFSDEKGQSGLPDTLTQSLNIDDKVLKDIIRNLYYPDSPYVFSQIPTVILGQVYEQFLGKVIRLTAGHQAKVEEKPEVRKAGGVYYTPTYIVEYIVRNTVGKLVNGELVIQLSGYPVDQSAGQPDNRATEKQPTPADVAKLKIVDPACGSGSFLLGAYEYLLDWHLRWYTANNPEKWAGGKNPVIFQVVNPHPASPKSGEPQPDLGEVAEGRRGSGWQLTTAEKKRILLNNLYGVDIDAQAVEVTKLSLLLKVLEGESQETLGSQLTLFKERVLPDLSANIKCGNSLIGPDYYEARQLGLGFPDEAELYRVNAFDWQKEFPQVFDPHRPSATSPKYKSDEPQSDLYLGEAGRGFDAVIGNPPYIRIQALQEWAPTEVEFYKKKYTSASKGNYDIYVVFVEKALSLLNKNGRLGFILPHKFFNAQYGEPLRGVLANGKHLAKVAHFGDQQIFENATTYTCLLFLDKAGRDEFEIEKVKDLAGWRTAQQQTSEQQTSEFFKNSEVSDVGRIAAANVTAAEWNFTVGEDAGLFEKLFQMPVKLGDIANIFVGLQTSADTVFLFKNTQKINSSTLTVQSKELGKPVEIETGILKSVVRSGEIGRYWANPTAEVIFPYETADGKFRLIPEVRLKADFPKTWDYLLENKKLLAGREHGKFKDIGWYQLYPKNLDTWEQTKIMLPYMTTRLSAFYDEGNYYFVNVTTGGFGLTIKDGFGNYKYITGLLNSKLLDWFMKKVSTTFHGGYFAANKQFLVQLPIRPIDFSNPTDRAAHEKMGTLVESMLALHRRQQSAHTPQEKEMLARQIKSTDESIDRLVYALYGLSEEEIKIVEG